VSVGPSSAIALALYNAVGNLGGLVGPWLIGRVVSATGLYASAVQALGVMVGVAGGLAWYMRRWNV
jgi:predicted MFS family arabinose efflux permease